MTTIINGRVFTGNNISINCGRIVIDGEECVNVKELPEKEINITITGDVSDLKVDYCNRVQVNGSVKKLQTASGDVEVDGNVTGGIQTASGDVDVTGNVDGDVQTASGDVDCGNVSGRVSTMSGNIRHK
ncbi:hypothetical protein J5751_01735 [bacterium]|nr:hypothetical protein [bacterium]